MKTKNLIIWVIILLIVVSITYYSITKPKMGRLGSTHEHADFKVYINGNALNFAQPKYMVKTKLVHIENMIGTEIHKHATGVTIGYFFKSLGFKFNNECFVLDNKDEFCDEDNKELKFYVNGQRNTEYGDYEIRDHDKYLISYGDESDEEIQKQLNLII